MAEVVEFEPGALGVDADPYETFGRLRAAGPLARTSSGFVIATGHATANAVLRDRRFCSGLIAERYRAALPPGAARDEMSYRINFLDPPDHPRVRGLVNAAFTPKRVAGLRDHIDAIANELIDPVRAALDAGRSADLLAEFAHPLPSLVISELLGVPVEDRHQLTEWTEAVTPLLGVQIDPDEKARALAASEQFAVYAASLLHERMERPGDDLLTALTQAEDDAVRAIDGAAATPGAHRLSRPELLSLVVTLYSAGHRTTRDLFTNGLFTLLQHPPQLRAVVDDPDRSPAVVQEMLRYVTPTLYVARIPGETIELEGLTLEPTDPVLVLLAAANRDPQRFREPDRFAIDRDEGPPLSFAAGPHVCLGAPLARLEAELMLRAVVRHLDAARLVVTDPSPDWRQSGPFRGLTHLRVAYTAAR